MKTKFLAEWLAIGNRKEDYGAKKKKCQDIIDHFREEGYEFVSVEFDDNKVPFFQTLRLAALLEKISQHLRTLKHVSKPTTTSSSSSNTTTAGRASGSSSGSSGSSSSRSSSSSGSGSSSSSSSGSSKDDVSSKTCAVKKATKMNNIDDDMDGILDRDLEEEGIDVEEEVNKKKKPRMTIKRLPKKRKFDDDDVEDDDVDDDNVVDLTAESPIKMPKLRPIKEPKKKRSHMHHTAASDSTYGTGDEVA
jgi:hypothetical protein